MNRNKVILVDNHDNAIGEMDKTEAHLKGELHRAFSIFIFNSNGKMLIQQRAKPKYHGGGLWTNACCSHPQWGENIKESAIARLHYEMGLQCDIEWHFSFLYKAGVENGLIEHELDHVFIGCTDGTPEPHPEEVMDFKWIWPSDLLNDITNYPDNFTYWFKASVKKVLDQYFAMKHSLSHRHIR